MADSLLVIDGKEYVVVPKRRYDRLTREERDRKDSEIAARAIGKFKAGKLKTISMEQMKRELGMAD